MRPNTPFTPSPKLTPEGNPARQAVPLPCTNLMDGGLLPGIAPLLTSNYLGNDLLIGLSLLMMMVSIISSALFYYCCPFCGNNTISGPNRERLGPYVWRSYEYPVCNFSPDWGR